MTQFSLHHRASVDEPILLNIFDSVSASSEIELSDAASPLASSSPLARAAAGAAGADSIDSGSFLPQGGSLRRGSSSSKAPGVATIDEESERLMGGGSLAGSPRGGSPLSGAMTDRTKPLSLLPLIALIFYDVSGGPFGIEDAVSKGSPLLAVLGFLILPLIWSVPEALVTAELATTFPENSGYVAWVTAAFGPFWGFQKGLYAWVSGVTDNAVYPVLFLNYLQEVWPVLESYWPRLFFLLAFNLALTYLNYRGLHVVGEVAVGMTIFTLLPFIALCLLGLPHVRSSNWLLVDWGAVQWLPFLNVMFWNLNYWDSVSCLAGEVRDPSKTFPRALAGAVVLVVTCYLLPLLVGLGVTAHTTDWELGYFAVVGQTVGGKWLAWWIVAAATVSQIGQFEAEMSSDSFQLQGMAERGFLPALFNKRSKHGTPVYAIMASSAGIMGMASFNFLEIVELLNCAYCMGQLLEFVAFVWLRIRHPTLHRPYRIPLPTWGCVAMLVPACLLLVGLLIVPWVQATAAAVGMEKYHTGTLLRMLQDDLAVISFTFATVALGCVLHPALQAARRRGWIRFEGTTPTEFKEMLYTMYVPSDEEAKQGTAPLPHQQNGGYSDSTSIAKGRGDGGGERRSLLVVADGGSNSTVQLQQ